MKLSEMNLQELAALYSVATDERQMYFSIKDRITNELKNRLLTEIEYE